jgi:hypothetical protein
MYDYKMEAIHVDTAKPLYVVYTFIFINIILYHIKIPKNIIY